MKSNLRKPAVTVREWDDNEIPHPWTGKNIPLI